MRADLFDVPISCCTDFSLQFLLVLLVLLSRAVFVVEH